jgi:hypothetical protein
MIAYHSIFLNGIDLVDRKNVESKNVERKNIESAINAASIHPFINAA